MFRTDLITRDLSTNDGPMFELIAPLVYESPRLMARYVVPAGFTTDFASIPQPLWAILPPVGAYDKAAVLHDHLYRSGGMDRSLADLLLSDGMIEADVTPWKRWMVYAGVRLGGWKRWHYYRQKDNKLV